MKNKDFMEKWYSCLDKMAEGDKNFCRYGLNCSGATFVIGSGNIKPVLLFVYWQMGENRLFRGVINGKPVGFSDEDSEKDSIIGILTDVSKKRNMEVLVSSKDSKLVYNEDSLDDKEHHKLIILNENKLFTDLVYFDSRTHTPPSRLFFDDEASRRNLRNLGFGLLGAHSSTIYELISKSSI